jgi:hypothetical protein
MIYFKKENPSLLQSNDALGTPMGIYQALTGQSGGRGLTRRSVLGLENRLVGE